jgi:hypothetical protein
MNTCATTTPSVVNGSVTAERAERPARESHAAEREQQGEAGNRGREHHGQVDERLEQALARNSRVASTYAAGVPSSATIAVAAMLVTMLSRSAPSTAG